MSKITAHDFSHMLESGYSFTPKNNDLVNGFMKIINGINDGTMAVCDLQVTSKCEPDDMTYTTITIKLIEKAEL
jgi:hypothetical protein